MTRLAQKDFHEVTTQVSTNAYQRAQAFCRGLKTVPAQEKPEAHGWTFEVTLCRRRLPVCNVPAPWAFISCEWKATHPEHGTVYATTKKEMLILLMRRLRKVEAPQKIAA